VTLEGEDYGSKVNMTVGVSGWLKSLPVRPPNFFQFADVTEVTGYALLLFCFFTKLISGRFQITVLVRPHPTGPSRISVIESMKKAILLSHVPVAWTLPGGEA